LASSTNAGTRAALDAIVDLCDAGAAAAKLRIYSGTVPTDADTALGAQVLLAELTMSDPAFGAAADANPGASASANAISDDTAADATGTASFARIVDSDGNVVLQLTVSATGGGGELQLNTTSLVANATVRVTALNITHPD
jgi:hypothetical protein